MHEEREDFFDRDDNSCEELMVEIQYISLF